MHFSKNFVGGAKLIFCQCLRLLNRVSFATSRGDTKKPIRTSRPDLWIICQSCSVFSHTSVWFRKSQFWYFSSLLLPLLVLLQQLLLMVQQLLFLQLLVLLTLRKGALTTEAFFQGHFFKAREPTYQSVRIKINKMIFFSLFFASHVSLLEELFIEQEPEIWIGRTFSEKPTRPDLLGLGWRTEDGPDGLVKHRLEALLRQRGALQILDSTDVFGHRQTLENKLWSLCEQGP